MDNFNIHCDSCGRDYYTDGGFTRKELRKWIDKPCPACGANLLTKGDYNIAKVIILLESIDKIIAFICRIFGKKLEQKTVRFETSGTGKLSFTLSDKEASHD